MLALLLSAVLAADVRVEVWTAQWCPACRVQARAVAKLRAEGLPVFSVDYDARRDEARKRNVRALPTSILYVDGKERTRREGVVTEDVYRRWLQQKWTE